MRSYNSEDYDLNINWVEGRQTKNNTRRSLEERFGKPLQQHKKRLNKESADSINLPEDSTIEQLQLYSPEFLRF
ncbi:hypothetical protein RhiirA4_474404 [Rhizophagus irregularis]|uniref:Uncharacterized protein n=1 Tax=Rhizophagus irregularis TaxID=588596 RepID=A0A2I1H8C6_9GLOM|nr:hypothetical protein RhiirA4_474404 [Rhizophagus irregularis]